MIRAGDLDGDGDADIPLDNHDDCDGGAFLSCDWQPRFWRNRGDGMFDSYGPVIRQEPARHAVQGFTRSGHELPLGGRVQASWYDPARWPGQIPVPRSSSGSLPVDVPEHMWPNASRVQAGAGRRHDAQQADHCAS
ncbi:MAG: hypothetical protein ACK57N_14695 [Planctomycetia bacterium]